MKHLIIGGGIAGISAAKAIRSRDSTADITLITAEPGKAYHRPLIPYLIETPDRDISIAGDPYKEYATRTVLGAVESVDTEAHEVMLSSEERLTYDRLLIASGATPLIPEIEGIQGRGCFLLRTAQDALSIAQYASGKGKAVIIGAGLVGIKAALSLSAIGLKVTLIEQLDRILSRRIDRRGAAILQRALTGNGFNVFTGTTARSVVRSAEVVSGVILASGNLVDADMVVVAAGTEPNLSFLRGTGIMINRGINVNERLETTIAGIYAAGDVAEYFDVVSGQPAISALWTTAEEMGRLAGINMAGGSLKYRGFLATMNATEIIGIPFISVGLIEPDDNECEVFVDDRIDSYRKLAFRDDRLAGFVFLGDVDGAGIYTNLVRSRKSLGGLKDAAVADTLKFIRFLGTTDNKEVVGTSS